MEGGGGTLSRVFCKRVRICVISKELVNTLDAKSEERVRKEKEVKELEEEQSKVEGRKEHKSRER